MDATKETTTMRRRIIIAERFFVRPEWNKKRCAPYEADGATAAFPSARETAESKSFFFFCCLTRSFSSSVVPSLNPPVVVGFFWRRSTASWKKMFFLGGCHISSSLLFDLFLLLLRPFPAAAVALVGRRTATMDTAVLPGKHNHPHSSFHYFLWEKVLHGWGVSFLFVGGWKMGPPPLLSWPPNWKMEVLIYTIRLSSNISNCYTSLRMIKNFLSPPTHTHFFCV